jgi:hypothetical protein
VVSFTPLPLYSRRKRPGTIPIGGWVGPRGDLDAVEYRKISYPCWKLNPGNPACSPSTCQLSLCISRQDLKRVERGSQNTVWKVFTAWQKLLSSFLLLFPESSFQICHMFTHELPNLHDRVQPTLAHWFHITDSWQGEIFSFSVTYIYIYGFQIQRVDEELKTRSRTTDRGLLSVC